MNRILYAFVFLFFSNSLYSQVKFRTDFYKITIPENTTFRTYKSIREEEANIDVYEFSIDSKIKYFVYLMSSQMSGALTVDRNNFQDFLADLGELNIEQFENRKGNLKIHFTYKDNEFIKGIVYLSTSNDILNRLVFLLPNVDAKSTFSDEIDKMVDDAVKIKNQW